MQAISLSVSASEERYRLLVETVTDYAIFILNPDGTIATWNPGARQIKGYEASEIIGRHFSVFYSEEEARDGKPDRELVEALERGKYTEEGWRYRKDGSRFWANIVITPLRNERGECVGFGKVTRDLSERKKTEDELRHMNAELRQSQAFVDSLLEHLPNMIFVKEAKELRFVRFNRAGGNLLGRSPGEMIGKNDYDFFPKKQADFFTSKDREVLNGNVIVDIPEEKIDTLEHGTRILHTRKIPIFDAKGKAEYLLGISEDITDQKEAERERLEAIRKQAALEEREHASRRMMFLAEASTLLSSSLDYKKTLGEFAKLVTANLASWCTITIVDEDGTIRRVAAAHHRPEKTHLVDELNAYYPVESDQTSGIIRVITTGKTQFTPEVSAESLKMAAKDDRHFEIMSALGCHSTLIVPILSRGRVLGAISFVSDQKDQPFDETDLAMAEELGKRAGSAIDNALLYSSAQRAIRARDEFLSIASHELKTPLTSLKLQVQITQKNLAENRMPTPERLKRVLDLSSTQVSRLTALIDDLLDISRIDSGKLSYRFEPYDLSTLAHEMAERYAEPLAASGCSIEVKANESLPVSIDRFRMEQVLANLLTNAARYGKSGPVRIETFRRGDEVILACSDRGIGIPADKLEKIFDRFERVSPESTRGLGLGLYITREIVRAHGGRIWVESELGKGSTFFVALPHRPLTAEESSRNLLPH